MHYDDLMTRVGRRFTPAVDDEPARRRFLKLAAGGGFALGLFPVGALAADDAGGSAAAAPKAPPPFAHPSPAAFVSVTPAGELVVRCNRLDFGQGVATTLAMLVAEEMDADWRTVRAELAPAADVYRDPAFGIQMTGGSHSTAASWTQYRELGAKARAMFVAAAAQRFQVDASQVTIAEGVARAGSKRATLPELANAAMQQPVPADAKPKDPSQFRIIGQPTRQLSGPAKSTGTQAFGLDTYLPGIKTVVIARPPVFGAKVATFDAGGAKAVKGVVDAFQVPLDRGAIGVAVVADGYWPAHQGRDALKATWNTDGVEKVDSERQLAQYRELAGKAGVVARAHDVSALAGAPRKISADYWFPYLAHTPMEPLNCVIDVTDAGARVWAGSQFQTMDQMAIAGVLGLKPAQVEFHTMFAGGGFGRRAVPTSDYLFEAAQVAKAWRASGRSGPLKIVWSREDDVHGGYYRPVNLHRVEIGFDDTGRILAWQHRIVGQSIIAGTPFEPFMIKNGVDSTTVEGVADTAYDLPMAVDVHHPKVNVPVLWWRSVGNTHTAYVMETLVDELARASRQDPVAYRMKLLKPEAKRQRAALQLAVDKSGYGRTTLPQGQAWGVAVHESFNTVVAYVVVATIEDGKPRLLKVTGAVHCNRAVNPLNVEAQVQGAALMGLGTTLPGAAITLKDGVVQQSNFHEYTVARMPQMPAIEIFIVPSDDAPTGVGEPGLPPLAPAYANALAALTGKVQRQLPFV
jgi:isoquinoline 1-oxidoreductase beta subunit